MKLHELEDEINAYKRVIHKDWDDGVNYLIKSTMPDSPLYYCDFMSMQLKEFTPTTSDLFDDVWMVLSDEYIARPKK